MLFPAQNDLLPYETRSNMKNLFRKYLISPKFGTIESSITDFEKGGKKLRICLKTTDFSKNCAIRYPTTL